MKRIVIALWVSLVATAIVSCNNQTDNSATTSQTNTESSEPAKVVREEPKSNPIDKFVGRYSIKDGGPNVVEVLSDGRIIFDNVGNKSFLGNIKIISDDAFMISSSDPSEKIYVSKNTPLYQVRDGVEHNGMWSGDGNEYTKYLVFDIKENRLYTEGYNKYMSRDIASVTYMKLVH